jgi:hypothetical protein
MSTVCGSYGATTRLMSDLTSSLATLAERLGRRRGTARVPDVARPPGIVDMTGILAMPLDQFACEGQSLEVRVPWLDATLWFVSEEQDAEALLRDGVSRGRAWTARELMDVMAISERTSDAIRTIALAKLTFDGDIIAVSRRSGG